jgi:hypothetical protein
MPQLLGIKHMVDRGVKRLELAPADHPLRNVDPLKLRRLLAEAAFRELRELQREITQERPERP